MDDAAAAVTEKRRGIAARLGIGALNLLAPGLGLIRLGKARAALAWLFAPLILAAIPAWLIAVTGAPPAGLFFATMVLVGFAIVGCYVWTIVLTWRNSAVLAEAPPWWTRWYGVILALVMLLLAIEAGKPVLRFFYRPFSIPSQSMMPGLLVGDQFWANMREGHPPRIGQIVLLSTGGHVRVYRIAACAGDRIAMRGGVPVVNGAVAIQRADGTMSLDGAIGTPVARRFVERLPGEAGTHLVLDNGPSDGDEMDEVTVPAGHVFVLGDNRDMSADSRYPPAKIGVGMVPEAAIVGVPLVFMWSGDRSRIAAAPR